MIKLPKKVKVREVALRDGIQSLKEFIPTATKVDILNRLLDCGFEIIEVTSFVHPKWIPQLRDAEELVRTARKNKKTKYVALVPNAKGVERAIRCGGLDGVGITMAVSESHNQKNVGMSRVDSMKQAKEALELAVGAGLEFVGGTSVAFGCPMEGKVPFEDLLWVVDNYVSIGAKTVRLGDTTGMANPRQVAEYCEKLADLYPGIEFNLHLHNTRGMGLANILAGIEAGVTFIDGAICGLGGCPYAPGASGNIDTIDLVHMLHQMGIETGIDLNKLIDVGRYVETVMGQPLNSSILRAGTVGNIYDAN
ncbi:MAG: hydroxymethylglutaryl-CoA lyase [Deltaproteobacteria bacterium]